MKKIIPFLFPCLLMAQSMLEQADAITRKYAVEVAKAPPPLQLPQPQSCLDAGSVWFSIDLNEIAAPAFDTLNQEELWTALRDVGVQAVHLRGLKKGGNARTGIELDPKWGEDFDDLLVTLQKKNILLAGDSMGNSTGLDGDFILALKNSDDYPGLYHLVEIEKKDWKWLPTVAGSGIVANVPWLSVQELHKKGYVPERFNPYVKESSWNATPQIKGSDGKVRRWIYLKENCLDPVIDWLNPSFAGFRIASADLLDSVFNLGEKIVKLDADLSTNAKETLTLWARKLGSFAVQEGKGGLDELKHCSADLMADTLTRPALLHALIAEDAEALRLMYRLFLEEGIETKRLVHVLQPFDQFTCDWAELLLHPKRKFQYYDEILTGEALRTRLLKEDADRIGGFKRATWPALCATATEMKDHREDAADTHLLLAFFYALQPGAFSFSVSDLLGSLCDQTVDLMGTNENTLYASFPGQMKNPKSFAMQLRKILGVRREHNLESGELIAVPETNHRGLLLLVHQLKSRGMVQILAVNFSKTAASQVIEMPCIRQTTAIDLMTGLAEKKPLDSATIRFEVPPLSGKVILFQPKYFGL